MAKLGNHERGHGWIEVAFPTYDTNVGKFGHDLAREMVQDARPQRHRSLARTKDLHMGDQRTGEHRVPARFCRELSNVEPGLLLELARNTAREIDAVDRDIVEIRRAAGEIDLP